MKMALLTVLLSGAMTASVSGAFAADELQTPRQESTKINGLGTGELPRGGWDGNNVRLSVFRSKLVKAPR